MLMEVRDEQPEKQRFPKLVTEEGMSMEVRDEQPRKQSLPRLVTEEGITVLAHPAIIVLLCVSIIALQFSRESYTGLFSSTMMEERALQYSKQKFPNLVTEEGMSMEVRAEQFQKQLSPRLVTEEGMVMEVRDEPEKQPSPKLVTEEGITVLAHPAIIVLLSVSIIALQFSLESYTGLASSTMMEVRDEQDWKHPFPNLVTEEGMVTEVRDLQT